jgi:glycosyltransferase involved in cell wall biosynthesis
MFYNLLQAAEGTGRCLEDFFPESRDFFKHPLVRAAGHCDATFAVGALVAREMRFMDGGAGSGGVEAAYNGVPAARQTLDERKTHRHRMIEYARNLCALQPDYVFTHVARPVLSKGIWRDLRVLHELEPTFKKRGKTGVYFMLGTLAGQRRTRDVLHMERVYGWPVHHERGYPDLCNGEEALGETFEAFNRDHRCIRAVLVNQFGWEQRLCGLRMPADMTLDDIRRGADVEFGMSVYEPFGISQLEPLASGAICVVSNVCGCLDLLRHCSPEGLGANVLVANFIALPKAVTARQALKLSTADRDAVEAAEGKRLADELARRLPADEAAMAALLTSGWDVAGRLDWERVVREIFLPAVRRTCRQDELGQSQG